MKSGRASWSSPRPTSMATAPATSSGPFMGTPSLLAFSGKDGSLLWAYSADPGGPAMPRSVQGVLHPGRIMGAPAAVDVDGDGITDLIAEFVVLDDPQGLVTPPVEWPGRGTAAEKTFAAVASSWPCRAGRESSSGIT